MLTKTENSIIKHEIIYNQRQYLSKIYVVLYLRHRYVVENYGPLHYYEQARVTHVSISLRYMLFCTFESSHCRFSEWLTC